MESAVNLTLPKHHRGITDQHPLEPECTLFHSNYTHNWYRVLPVPLHFIKAVDTICH